MTREIPLTQGRVALVDDEDYQALSVHRWMAHVDRGGHWYALRATPRPRRSMIWMHRVILDAPVGPDVDHINGDGLDNRRVNLRLATREQNAANAPKMLARNGKPTTSKFKGVCRVRSGKWMARHRRAFLGHFTDEVAAADAYDVAALSYSGEFARLNFPPEVAA